MNKMSIKLRITLWYSLIMLAIATAALMIIFSWSRAIITQDITVRLIRTVSNSARMQVDPKGRIHHAPDFMYFENGVHLAVYDKQGQLIDGQIPFEAAKNTDFQNEKIQTLMENGTLYYIYDQKIEIPNQESLWIRGAISFSGEDYMVRSIVKTNITVTIILILVAAVGGYFMVKRALTPVDIIRKTAKEICESQDLSQRISIGSGKDEICQLANTFDEMLEKLEQTLEQEKQFTSDASHELRTPVAVIMSECEYMLDCAKAPEEFKESAESIKKQTTRMTKLIAELLSFSRMDNGTQQLNFEPLDISELLTIVCEEQQEIHNSSITMSTQIQPNVMVTGDHFLLTRLFINLISNAYQYGRENGKIHVVLKEENGLVIVSVADNGIGIAPNELPNIWKRFYQVDASRTDRGNGSMGLGLSMVQWIAKQHKGTVKAESQLGKGSVFTFSMRK